ncbi:MAG: class I SAM-dependent methyltransferase [Elusimicrobiota bacterium]
MNLSFKSILHKFIKKTFYFWQSLGFHVTPVHYYEPIPDTRTLDKGIWNKPSEMIGIDIRENDQIGLMKEFSGKYSKEYNAFPRKRTSNPSEYFVDNDSFATVDGEILYCMIRHFKPKKIFEIGSGFSTMLSAQAVLKNESENSMDAELTAFEPYPNKIIKKGFPGFARLEQKCIQEVELPVFIELRENDILFIDSSHVLKIGSDVQYEYLEILPRLNKGVIIHIHDIFMPYEYHQRWIFKDNLFWNEQYLLQAFLAFNDSFEVLWGGSYMKYRHSKLLENSFNSYTPVDWPGSFWIRKTR